MNIFTNEQYKCEKYNKYNKEKGFYFCKSCINEMLKNKYSLNIFYPLNKEKKLELTIFFWKQWLFFWEIILNIQNNMKKIQIYWFYKIKKLSKI